MEFETHKGRIFYFCTDSNDPTGGIKKIYQHVDILNELGLKAFVLHKELGFRCTWFQNTTKIAYTELSQDLSVLISDNGIPLEGISLNDVLVVPEILAHRVMNWVSSQGFYTVIFNQNAYYTFIEMHDVEKYSKERSAYNNPNLLGVMVVSDENKQYLEYVFPRTNFYRIHNAVDFDCFTYQKEKKRQIAFMPRKCVENVKQVICILKERGVLHNWSLASIHTMSELQVAQVLRDSLIFLSFSQAEGFGLPPIEAISCGCIVIGYHGFGGREYFQGPTIFPVAQGEIIEYVKVVEKVINEYELKREAYEQWTYEAKEKIHKEYSKEREREELSQIWKTFLQKKKIASSS